ncbi:MAG: lytic transglycosylase domain-containing protein, partial [Myxococcota bacterium]|nr:lytic transglycosylase domain-containing protein [Myxococcota bacterium]
ALLRLGRTDEAIACALSVREDIAAHDELRLALADGYAAKGDRASALPLWRGLLAASPHGLRWVDLSMQLAAALLDGIDGPRAARAHEAFELTTRVIVEAPSVADRLDAAGLRSRAASLLPSRVAPSLTFEERAHQVQGWLDASESKRAIDAADALLHDLSRGDTKHREAGCKAATVRAQAIPRAKSLDVAIAWDVAIHRCDGEDALATALYYGGKASASAHRAAEALDRFGRVEKLFPSHRLADDARFRAALVRDDQGDQTGALAMLASLPDIYPEGDMRGEALFRVALARFVAGDLSAARELLDRVLESGLDERGWGSAGRAAYFRARVAQLSSDVADAKRRYAALIAQQPLSYNMLLAYARLRALDESAARSALEVSIAGEPPGPLVMREHDELASRAFERFARLLEVGEIDAARREAHSGGLLAEGMDPEVLWTVARFYDRAGSPELGHSLARTRLAEYRAHWPAGRWRAAWEIAFPHPWDLVVSRESESTGVPVALTWAIMREESAFNPDARSVANALGLMQLMGGTARLAAKGSQLPCDEDALRRPEVSIALGTRVLSSLRATFATNPALAVAAYNGGPGAVRRWLLERGSDDLDLFVERIPYDETRNYIKRVLASQAAYAYLYAPGSLEELLALPSRAAAPAPWAQEPPRGSPARRPDAGPSASSATTPDRAPSSHAVLQ